LKKDNTTTENRLFAGLCYNLKLSSDYNSDKDLSKSRENDQLVKCKNTRLYILLYILTNHNK